MAAAGRVSKRQFAVIMHLNQDTLPSAVMSTLEHAKLNMAILDSLDRRGMSGAIVLYLELTLAGMLILHPLAWIQQLKLCQS